MRESIFLFICLCVGSTNLAVAKKSVEKKKPSAPRVIPTKIATPHRKRSSKRVKALKRKKSGVHRKFRSKLLLRLLNGLGTKKRDQDAFKSKKKNSTWKAVQRANRTKLYYWCRKSRKRWRECQRQNNKGGGAQRGFYRKKVMKK